LRLFVTTDTAVPTLGRQTFEALKAKRGFVMTTRHLISAALLSFIAMARKRRQSKPKWESDTRSQRTKAIVVRDDGLCVARY
jgi:hypothetical protein